jgi:hypothetical protein
MSLTEADLESAWRAHEPARAVVPAEAWRRLRDFKGTSAPTAMMVEKMLRDQAQARTMIAPLIRHRGVHRQRLLNDLRKVFPAASVNISHKEILDVAWLSPKGPLIIGGKAGEQQDCILACYAIAYPVPGLDGLSLHSGWALEIADHAAARLLQRAPDADLRRSALEAALGFATADASVVQLLIGEHPSIYLSAGPGVFAANVIGGKTLAGQKYIYARCKTFVPAAWLKPDQRPLPRADRATDTVAIRLWRWG